ncbi:F-box/FBD/LRR-repeat protein At5g22660-like [Rutidosis leptorrhynchoides]|uniref:F-box/FBD/LRR-repeat protein At5g22660-like n=1 Tax=Rutidosis leptorrhynchoides TaxID=125765 RepID=UPI003A9A5894
MDLISKLPDEVLVHILAYLDTEEAISTSILSKRRKDVWVYLPNLVFDIESPTHAILDSMDGILDRMKSPEVHVFTIVCKHIIRRGSIAKWIDNAFRLNAQDIYLDVHSLELPLSFFNFNSLTWLHLSSIDSRSIRVPNVFCLPNLEYIRFFLINPHKELTEKLFRSCPNLEELHIRVTGHHEDQVYDISSSSLMLLDINLCGFSFNPPKVILNVPNLDDITIKETIGVDYVVRGPLSPICAYISLQRCCLELHSQEDGDRAHNLLNMLSQSNSISFDDSTTYMLSKYHLNNVPTFHHLNTLEMTIPRLCGWTYLFNVLESCRDLLVLTITKDCNHYEDSPLSITDQIRDLPEDFDWTDPHTPPACLLSRLEEIVLIGYFWMNCDMKAIKYLLSNAKVLKSVSCRARRNGVKGEKAFWKEVDEYAKSLPSCSYEISFKDEE